MGEPERVNVAGEMVKAAAVLAAVVLLTLLTVCPAPSPRPAAVNTDSVRVEAAQRDTVFVRDTVRLMQVQTRVVRQTDSIYVSLPDHIETTDGVPTDTATVCFGLAAFDAWRVALRGAILDERKTYAATIAVRNLRIADLQHDVGTLTVELEREQRRRRGSLVYVVTGATAGAVTAVVTGESPLLGLALGGASGKLLARVVRP